MLKPPSSNDLLLRRTIDTRYGEFADYASAHFEPAYPSFYSAVGAASAELREKRFQARSMSKQFSLMESIKDKIIKEQALSRSETPQQLLRRKSKEREGLKPVTQFSLKTLPGTLQPYIPAPESARHRARKTTEIIEPARSISLTSAELQKSMKRLLEPAPSREKSLTETSATPIEKPSAKLTTKLSLEETGHKKSTEEVPEGSTRPEPSLQDTQLSRKKSLEIRESLARITSTTPLQVTELARRKSIEIRESLARLTSKPSIKETDLSPKKSIEPRETLAKSPTKKATVKLHQEIHPEESEVAEQPTTERLRENTDGEPTVEESPSSEERKTTQEAEVHEATEQPIDKVGRKPAIAKAEPAKAKAEPAKAKADPAKAKAEPAKAKAEPALVKAEPAKAKAKPGIIAKGKLVVDKAKSALAKSEPAIAKAKPEPAIAKAEPAIAKAEPAIVKAEPAIVKAEPAKAKTEPAVAKVKPALAKTEPAKAKAEPAKSKTEPALAKAEPAKTKTEPALVKSEPAKAKAESAKAKAEPAKAKAEPPIAKAKPAVPAKYNEVGAAAKVALTGKGRTIPAAKASAESKTPTSTGSEAKKVVGATEIEPIEIKSIPAIETESIVRETLSPKSAAEKQPAEVKGRPRAQESGEETMLEQAVIESPEKKEFDSLTLGSIPFAESKTPGDDMVHLVCLDDMGASGVVGGEATFSQISGGIESPKEIGEVKFVRGTTGKSSRSVISGEGEASVELQAKLHGPRLPSPVSAAVPKKAVAAFVSLTGAKKQGEVSVTGKAKASSIEKQPRQEDQELSINTAREIEKELESEDRLSDRKSILEPKMRSSSLKQKLSSADLSRRGSSSLTKNSSRTRKSDREVASFSAKSSFFTDRVTASTEIRARTEGRLSPRGTVGPSREIEAKVGAPMSRKSSSLRSARGAEAEKGVTASPRASSRAMSRKSTSKFRGTISSRKSLAAVGEPVIIGSPQLPVKDGTLVESTEKRKSISKLHKQQEAIALARSLRPQAIVREYLPIDEVEMARLEVIRRQMVDSYLGKLDQSEPPVVSTVQGIDCTCCHWGGA